VTASRDAKVHIWDADSGNELRSFSNIGFGLMSAVFSPDGERIATLGSSVSVWDLKAGKATRTFGRGVIGLEVEFSPNGRKIMAASMYKEIDIWPILSLPELINESRQSIQRCLTQNERRIAFLDPEPPTWCIEMEKWPYQTQDWKDWLQFRRVGANPPLPGTTEWHPWIAAHH
jgi:hypothetical protein